MQRGERPRAVGAATGPATRTRKRSATKPVAASSHTRDGSPVYRFLERLNPADLIAWLLFTLLCVGILLGICAAAWVIS